MANNKIFNNAKWIVACKVVQSLIQFVVGMLSARYLGPSNYGLTSYAASIVAFFVPIMQLGLRSTLVQEYVDKPEQEGKILGTSLVMNMVSAAACMIGVVAFAAVANRGEPETVIVCALYSASLFFQAIEMLQYWFQAKFLSKYSSLAMLCAYVAVATYKIYLLASGKSVYWFALSHAVEYGVTGSLLFIAYKKVGTQKLRFSFFTAKEIFSKSKHYILAALMVVIFNSSGNIMLKLMISETENGYFAAAVTCNGVTAFVFNAIIDTARPVILESRRCTAEGFQTNVARSYSLLIYLSLAQSIFFTVFARIIVLVLYGKAYMPAVPVLQILSWNLAFSNMGAVRNIWILGEQKHNILWIINAIGAAVNTLFNVVLIPVWGACGAAVASVLTQVITNFVLGFVLKPIQENNRLLLEGLNPKMLGEMMSLLKRQ